MKTKGLKFSKEQLENLYHKQKLSLARIGKKFNCTNSTILYWLVKFNIKRRQTWKLPEEAKKKISKALKGRPSPTKGKPPWCKGKKLPEEARRKISKALKGRKVSLETRKKLSLVQKGRRHTEETKRKLSNIFKGKKISKEQIQKLKDWYQTHGNPFKGKKHSEEARRKISKAAKGRPAWNKGKKWPEGVKKKISNKLKGQKLSFETRRKMALTRKGKPLPEITKKRISKAKKGKKMTSQHKKNYLKALEKSPNKFEEKCIDLFNRNNLPLKFVGNFNEPKFFIAGKIPDFVATNGQKIIVEVFCDYFKIKRYGSVENYKKIRTEIFSKYGWKVLFFSNEEIQSDFDMCLEMIKKELKENEI